MSCIYNIIYYNTILGVQEEKKNFMRQKKLSAMYCLQTRQTMQLLQN